MSLPPVLAIIWSGFQSRSRRLWCRRELGCRNRIMLVYSVVTPMLDTVLDALLGAAVVKVFVK
ncbi:hypothetical protein M422DRAFT_38741, partial [Sphaerobolus stellatus SS14]